jgi:hypothetical protein
MPKRGTRPSHKTIEGVVGKNCSSCDTWKPLNQYYVLSSGRHRQPCKFCMSLVHANGRWVRFKPDVWKWLDGVIVRVGKAEAARLVGFDKTYISKLVGKDPPLRVRADTAKAILETYISVVRSGVVLSKNSIRHGNFERGKPVNMATRQRDLYRTTGDQDQINNKLYKRRSRELHRETNGNA